MIVRENMHYVIEGPVTLDNVADLLAEGGSFEGENLVCDLARVIMVDSSALSLLLEWRRLFKGSGRQISFINLSQSLRSLAELYGVTDLIPVGAD